ncbi:MAG: pyridinium-3,5-bisthiocarboxylic acid mononucleotide nickel chelatase, partial [Clostridia bacterium]|nr:pyridinium-3,5-bisthiocarboxylic acid mononucleotide nickel chelatase [Clostridia bacterium]
MKTAYFDCFSGAAGNMIIGAFLDAGMPLAELEKELNKLNLQNEYTLVTRRVKKLGVEALYFDVETASPHHQDHDHYEHQHGHPHDHSHHDHDHHHEHSHAHEHQHAENHPHDRHGHDPHQHHRNYREIAALLSDAPLIPEVKALSLKILTRLGEAEAKVHGCSLEDVHFHEVGAIDT